MTRYLITGAAGMLGRDLQAVLSGRDVTALSRSQLDVTDGDAVAAAVEGHDVIVNAAGYTRVDDAESHEVDAFAINATGAAHLATAAARFGATLVQLSTDYVFDGTAGAPYTESNPRTPVSAYGRTKAEGERLALEIHPEGTRVIRTAWLYGEHGGNFAATILRLAGERDTIDVVDDQRGQPTWTMDLATRIAAMLDADVAPGNYHATNSGEATWFDFAQAVFTLAGLDARRVKPTTSSRFIRPAHRPAYSVLGHNAWKTVGLGPMRDWKSALESAFASGALGAS
ncbi:dTDP-4-dehydrorhamnose reductase [Salinibacterium sp. CAN_S4]|uniref:dTDP-4-dehydrorhamnose reductase n=1 Tax=Salinibacterium sp. CAN_S4 TaxID=2787727 RepID=UPI0018EFAB7B